MLYPPSLRARSKRQRLQKLGKSVLLGCALPLLLLGRPAHAAPPPISIPALSDDSAPPSSGLFGFMEGINRSATLLGDMWGLRTSLSKAGITLAMQDTAEYLGNVSGGVQKGFQYDSLLQTVVQMDTRRAFGHYGGLVNVSALSIHGNNLSANNLYTLQTASGIEADRATRLWEAWYDQKFLDEDRLDIKIGQQSLDQEFMVSNNAMFFVNTMFGWPMLPSADMISGGPAYPLSALGVRLSARPVDGITLLAGVFNGDPVKNNNGSDPQLQNARGTSFPWGDGRLVIAEAQFSYPALGSMVSPGEPEPLGWIYRIGAWHNSKDFNDVRYGTDGLSLADPSSNGINAVHHGNDAYYAVADRLVWRDPIDPNRTVGLFGRVMTTPKKDRNLIDTSLNLGMVFHSPFRYRTYDTFGVAMGYAHVSNQVYQYASEYVNGSPSGAAPAPTALGHNEKMFEVTYQYQYKPWIQIQPDIQYVINPGAVNASLPQPLKNILVLGVRTNISL